MMKSCSENLGTERHSTDTGVALLSIPLGSLGMTAKPMLRERFSIQ